MIGLALILLQIGGCGSKSAEPHASQAPGPVQVESIAASITDLPRSIRITGTLRGEEETSVAAKVGGRVVGIFRDVSDEAAPGTLLARIDSTDYELERDRVQLQLKQALAELGLTELPNEGFPVNNLPTVERAALQAQNSKARYDRGTQLHEQEPPLISDQEYADLRTTWEVAEADHRVALLEAEAQLAQARMLAAQVQIAMQRVADTEVVVPTGVVRSGAVDSAPLDLKYVVATRMVSVGDLLQVGTPLFRLVDPDPLKLRAAVPERRATLLQVGQRVHVTTDVIPGEVEGRVSRINPAVDVQTRTFDVEVIVPNNDRRLKPGSFVRADVEVGTASGVLMVPESAVVSFAGVNKVFVIEECKAVDRPVTIGERAGGLIEIIKGVAPSDRIVARPPATLTGGTPVIEGAPTDAAIAPTAEAGS